METAGDSNLRQYKVVPHNSNTYGIGPFAETSPVAESNPKIELWQTLMLGSFYGITLVFVSTVYCKEDGVIRNNVPWSFLLIPFSIALVPLGIYLFLYIKGQIGIVAASLFCMKTTIIGILLFCITFQVYLLLFRADDIVEFTYTVAFIPSYFCLAAPMIYFVIILPLCISCQQPFLYYGTTVIMYCAAAAVSLYYTVRRLDFPQSYVPARYIFYPIWIALGLHLAASIAKFKTRVWTIVFLLFGFIYTSAECIKLEGAIDVPWWMMSSLFAVVFAVPLFFFTC